MEPSTYGKKIIARCIRWNIVEQVLHSTLTNLWCTFISLILEQYLLFFVDQTPPILYLFISCIRRQKIIFSSELKNGVSYGD